MLPALILIIWHWSPVNVWIRAHHKHENMWSCCLFLKNSLQAFAQIVPSIQTSFHTIYSKCAPFITSPRPSVAIIQVPCLALWAPTAFWVYVNTFKPQCSFCTLMTCLTSELQVPFCYFETMSRLHSPNWPQTCLPLSFREGVLQARIIRPCLLFCYRVLPYSPGWPRIHSNPSASTPHSPKAGIMSMRHYVRLPFYCKSQIEDRPVLETLWGVWDGLRSESRERNKQWSRLVSFQYLGRLKPKQVSEVWARRGT